MTALVSIRRETAAATLFSVAGIIGTLISAHAWSARLPTALFYAVLVVNTYFSIRFFSLPPPGRRDQTVIDGVLLALYVILAFSIGSILVFSLVSTLLFAAAVLKYALLLGVMDRREILTRKIAIDGLGLLLCAAAFAGSYLGYPLASAWLQALLFGLANIYLLAVRPMYA